MPGRGGKKDTGFVLKPVLIGFVLGFGLVGLQGGRADREDGQARSTSVEAAAARAPAALDRVGLASCARQPLVVLA